MGAKSKNITNNKSRGLLLVGHGTRNSAGLREFAELGELVAGMLPDAKFQAAFLELAAPDVPDGIQKLADRGVDEIVVVPALLFAAGHAKRDIPTLVERERNRFPRIGFTISGALECHGKLLELSEQRFREAVSLADVETSDAALLLVGRGSNDDQATNAMHRYAGLLTQHLGIREHRVAFMAMAQPLLQSVLDELSSKWAGPVIVQPHLLFQGDLLSELRQRVAAVVRSRSGLRMIVAEHLGAAPLLAEALVELSGRADLDRLLDKDLTFG